MNNDITNVVTKLLNNFLMIPFRSAKYHYPCGYWYLTERNGILKKKIMENIKTSFWDIRSKLTNHFINIKL